MARHEARNTRRGAVVSVVAAAGAVLAVATAAPSSAGPQVPDIRDCQAAQEKAEAERAQVAPAQQRLGEANSAHDKATAALADARALPADDPARGEAIAKAQTGLAAAETERNDATDNLSREQAEAAEAESAANKACAVPPGEPGKTVVDERLILLDRSVCARAKVTDDPAKLVKVIVLVPCPPVTATPPAERPNPGDRVIIINRQAPAPETVESDLPVTG